MASCDLCRLCSGLFSSLYFSRVVCVRNNDFRRVGGLKEMRRIAGSLFFTFKKKDVVSTVGLCTRLGSLGCVAVPSALSGSTLFSPMTELGGENVGEDFNIGRPLKVVTSLSVVGRSPSILLLTKINSLMSGLDTVGS